MFCFTLRVPSLTENVQILSCVSIIEQYVFVFVISELTYNHTIKLDDEALTFDIRDAIEKVKSLFIKESCVSNFVIAHA